jgi:hypothetical protein
VIYEALSYWKHKDLTWRLPQGLDHCRDRPTFALTRGDLRSVCLVSPIAFAAIGEGLAPVLLNGPGFNKVVSFEDRWNQMRLPALVALHPFTVVWKDREKQWVLGVALDPSVVGADGGEPFFAPEGPLTRRLSVAHRRLCIAQAQRPALIEASGRLLAGGFLQDLPDTPGSRHRYKVMRRDRLDDLATSDQALDLELGYAAAFSLRALPDAVASSLVSRLDKDQAAAKDLDSVLNRPMTERPGDASPSDFLVDDDDTLSFSFSARKSAFKSG